MKNEDISLKAIKAGSYYVIGQFLIRGISLIATPIYTRTLSKTQFGEFKIFESWLLILVPVITLALYRSVEVAKYDYKREYEKYVSNIIRLGLVLSAVYAVFCFVFWTQIRELLGFTNIMMAYMILYILAEFAIMCFQRQEKQFMRYRSSLRLTLSTVTVGTFLSILLLIIGKNLGYQKHLVSLRIIGYYTPIIVGGFYVIASVWKRGDWGCLVSDWKYGLKYSIPLIGELISIQMMNQLDKIMIDKMVGSAEAGVYSLGTTISYIIWIIEEAVWGAWLPWLYEKIALREEKDIDSPWKKMMHTFGLISVITVLVAPELIWLLGGSDYKSGVYTVAPLICATLFRFYSYSLSAMQNYEKKTAYVAVGTIIAMLINILLNYIGILKIGYLAAAYTTSISYFFLMLIQAFFEYRICGHRIISLWRTLVISVAYFVLCMAVIVMYPWNMVFRYATALLVIIFFVLKNRFWLIEMIRKYKGKK